MASAKRYERGAWLIEVNYAEPPLDRFGWDVIDEPPHVTRSSAKERADHFAKQNGGALVYRVRRYVPVRKA